MVSSTTGGCSSGVVLSSFFYKMSDMNKVKGLTLYQQKCSVNICFVIPSVQFFLWLYEDLSLGARTP